MENNNPQRIFPKSPTLVFTVNDPTSPKIGTFQSVLQAPIVVPPKLISLHNVPTTRVLNRPSIQYSPSLVYTNNSYIESSDDSSSEDSDEEEEEEEENEEEEEENNNDNIINTNFVPETTRMQSNNRIQPNILSSNTGLPSRTTNLPTSNLNLPINNTGLPSRASNLPSSNISLLPKTSVSNQVPVTRPMIGSLPPVKPTSSQSNVNPLPKSNLNSLSTLSPRPNLPTNNNNSSSIKPSLLPNLNTLSPSSNNSLSVKPTLLSTTPLSVTPSLLPNNNNNLNLLSGRPSLLPTTSLSGKPSLLPTTTLNSKPSLLPTLNSKPSLLPTLNSKPSLLPTLSSKPSLLPTTSLNSNTSLLPTTSLNSKPSLLPTTTLNSKPSLLSNNSLSGKPSLLPSNSNLSSSSVKPSLLPSNNNLNSSSVKPSLLPSNNNLNSLNIKPVLSSNTLVSLRPLSPLADNKSINSLRVKPVLSSGNTNLLTPPVILSNNNINSIISLEAVKGEECCVCDDFVEEKNVMKCGHYTCNECLPQLPKQECPVCRAPLEGTLYNADIQAKIVESRLRDAMLQSKVNELSAYYGETHGESKRQLQNAYMYSEHFVGGFLSYYFGISDIRIRELFDNYIEFIQEYLRYNRESTIVAATKAFKENYDLDMGQ